MSISVEILNTLLEDILHKFLSNGYKLIEDKLYRSSMSRIHDSLCFSFISSKYWTCNFVINDKHIFIHYSNVFTTPPDFEFSISDPDLYKKVQTIIDKRKSQIRLYFEISKHG